METTCVNIKRELVNKKKDLDLEWINSITIEDADIISRVATAKFTDTAVISEYLNIDYLIIAINCIDLAALVGYETPEDIKKLCRQAIYPLEEYISNVDSAKKDKLKGRELRCASMCVYPLRVNDAVDALDQHFEKLMNIAAVAAGFPTGQFPIHTRLAEIYYAVACGANEIDVVIDRSLVLRGLWTELYDELVQMRAACKEAEMKVILSVTECGSWTNVYKAAAVAMSAGADFIKTSTGKEATPTTMHEGFVMCLAIKDFYNRTRGVKVGLKPAGGIRTADQAISWMLMAKEICGDQWIGPQYFRIGTSGSSSLIPSIAKAIFK